MFQNLFVLLVTAWVSEQELQRSTGAELIDSLHSATEPGALATVPSRQRTTSCTQQQSQDLLAAVPSRQRLRSNTISNCKDVEHDGVCKGQNKQHSNCNPLRSAEAASN